MVFTSNRHRITLRELYLITREFEVAGDGAAAPEVDLEDSENDVTGPAPAVDDHRPASFLQIGATDVHEVYYGGLGAALLETTSIENLVFAGAL